MTDKFGLVSYDEVDLGKPQGSNKRPGSKEDWMRLEQGNNELRIFTDPYQYTEHRYKVEGDKGYGERIRCSAVSHGYCPICAMRDPKTGRQLFPPKPRWLLGVIDRKTNSAKILDVSKSVFQALKKFNANDKIGDPKKYDINIEVDKNADPANFYSVQNYPKEPLSETDVELKKGFDLEALKRRCIPPPPDAVKELLLRIHAKKGVPAPDFENPVKPEKETSKTSEAEETSTKAEDSSEEEKTAKSAVSEDTSNQSEAFADDDEDDFDFSNVEDV